MKEGRRREVKEYDDGSAAGSQWCAGRQQQQREGNGTTPQHNNFTKTKTKM